MKAFLTGLIDDISLEAIEKFANVLMVKYEIALKQTGNAAYEFAIKVLQDELERARKELKDEDM